MEKERWLPVAMTNGKYEVSDMGRFRSVYNVGRLGNRTYRVRLIKPTMNDVGYYKVSAYFRVDGILVYKKFAIHRLVGQMFVQNPHNKTEINHKDLNKKNNCHSNLEWSTRKENMSHYFEDRRMRKKVKCHQI